MDRAHRNQEGNGLRMYGPGYRGGLSKGTGRFGKDVSAKTFRQRRFGKDVSAKTFRRKKFETFRQMFFCRNVRNSYQVPLWICPHFPFPLVPCGPLGPLIFPRSCSARSNRSKDLAGTEMAKRS